MAKSSTHKNAMLKTACPIWNDSTLHLSRVMSHIYNEKLFLIRCKQWVRTRFTYFKFQVMSVYFVFNYTFNNYSQSQSPVQCSARGSVIHSLVTCVQTSTVLWIKTFKIQILWKTKQQLIEWSYFHDVTVSTYFWQGSDIAVWTIQPSFDADDNDVALPGLGLALLPNFWDTFLHFCEHSFKGRQ